MIKKDDGDDKPTIPEESKTQEEQNAQEKIKVKKHERGPTICLCHCNYEIVHQVAEMYNLQEVEEDDNWDIFWSDFFVSFKRFRELKRFQRINHFPGMMEICRKDRLAKNLNAMLKLFPEEYNFFPRTWCFPNDLVQVLSYNRREQNKTYILKPVAGNKGRGILITKSLKDIRLDEKIICQEYLSRPYLIDGYKFDLRLYTLITSCDPLRIYIYNEGLVRFATCRYYEPTDFNTTNVFMHLTNYSVNKYSRKYKHDDQSGSKRKLTWLYQHMVALGYDVDQIWSSIDDVIIKTVFSILPTLRNSYYICFPDHDVVPACFELLGMDVILDNNLAPKLLEVNHSPSFHTDTPLDIEVKKGLLTDMFAMLNLEHADKSKNTSNNVPDNTSAECIKNTKKPTKVSYFIEYCCHEIQHKGAFRLIYPSKHQYMYNKIIEYAKSKFNQDIPCTRCVNPADQEEQMKDIDQEINKVNPTTTKIIHSEKTQSSHTLPIPPAVQDNSTKNKLVTYQPQNISEIEEEERMMHLAQREVLVKSFGIIDLIYLSQKRNGVLRLEDEKKYKKMKLTGKMKRLKLHNRIFNRQRNSPTKQSVGSKSSVQYFDLGKRGSKINYYKPTQPVTDSRSDKNPKEEMNIAKRGTTPQIQKYLQVKEMNITQPNLKQTELPEKCDTGPCKNRTAETEVKPDTGKNISKFLTREDFHNIFNKNQTKLIDAVKSEKCDKIESKTRSFESPTGRKNPYDDYMFSTKYNKPLIYNVTASEVQNNNAENERQATIIEKVINSSILSQSKHLICRTPPPSTTILNEAVKTKSKYQKDISKAEMIPNPDTNRNTSFSQGTKLSSNTPSSSGGNQRIIKTEFANKPLSSKLIDFKKMIQEDNFLDINSNDSFIASKTIMNMKNKITTAKNVSDSNKTDSISKSQPPPNILNNSTINSKELILPTRKISTTSSKTHHINRVLKKKIIKTPHVSKITSKVQNDIKESEKNKTGTTQNIPGLIKTDSNHNIPTKPELTSFHKKYYQHILPLMGGTNAPPPDILNKSTIDSKEQITPKSARSKTKPSSIFLKQKRTTSRANIQNFSEINKTILKRDSERKTNLEKLNLKMPDISKDSRHKISNPLSKINITDSKLNRRSREPLVNHQTSDTNKPSTSVLKKLSTREPLKLIPNLTKKESNASKYPSGIIQSRKRSLSQPHENFAKKPDTGSFKKSSSQSDVLKYKSKVNPFTSEVKQKDRCSEIILKKQLTTSGFPLQNASSNLKKPDSKPIVQQQSNISSTMSRPFNLVRKHSTINMLNVKKYPYIKKSVTKYPRNNQVDPQKTHRPPTVKKSKNKRRPILPFPCMDDNKTENLSQKPDELTEEQKYTNPIIKNSENVSKHWTVKVKSHDKSVMCMGVSRRQMKSNIW